MSEDVKENELPLTNINISKLNIDPISNNKIHEIILNARMNQINHINQLDQIINVIKKNNLSIRVRPLPSPVVEENPIRTYLSETNERDKYQCSEGCKYGLCITTILLWGAGVLYFATH